MGSPSVDNHIMNKKSRENNGEMELFKHFDASYMPALPSVTVTQ